jgi:hypothetical protein
VTRILLVLFIHYFIVGVGDPGTLGVEVAAIAAAWRSLPSLLGFLRNLVKPAAGLGEA